MTLWGGAFNSENFRAGFDAVSHRHREAAFALGFRPLRHVPERDAPASAAASRCPRRSTRTISVVKNTSLMYVIAYPELTTTAINISNLTLETTEALTLLAIVYLTLVWSLSFGDSPARASPGASGGALMPDWSGPVWHYILHEGLPNTLRVAAIALVGEHPDRRRARHAADDRLPPVPGADPALRRGASAACRSS